MNRFGAVLVWSSVFAGTIVVCLQRQSAAGIGEDIEPVIDRAVAVQATDSANWATVSGTGVVEFVRSDGQSTAKWDFRFRQRSRSLWAEYSLRRSESHLPHENDFDIVRIVADGNVMAAAQFAPWIPFNECSMSVRQDDEYQFTDVTSTRIDPRRYFLPPILRQRDLELYRSPQVDVSVEESSDAGDIICISLRENGRWRARTSKEMGDRITFAELFIPDIEQPEQLKGNELLALILEYRWDKTEAGLFFPAEITMRRIDTSTGDKFHTFKITMAHVDNRLQEDGEFLISSLNVPEGGQVVDYRPGRENNPATLYFGLPIDHEKQLSLGKAADVLIEKGYWRMSPVRTLLIIGIAVGAILLCTWLMVTVWRLRRQRSHAPA
jgi:hypothetical protein